MWRENYTHTHTQHCRHTYPPENRAQNNKTQILLFSHSSGISFIQLAGGGGGDAGDFCVDNVVDQIFLLLPACLPATSYIVTQLHKNF